MAVCVAQRALDSVVFDAEERHQRSHIAFVRKDIWVSLGGLVQRVRDVVAVDDDVDGAYVGELRVDREMLLGVEMLQKRRRRDAETAWCTVIIFFFAGPASGRRFVRALTRCLRDESLRYATDSAMPFTKSVYESLGMTRAVVAVPDRLAELAQNCTGAEWLDREGLLWCVGEKKAALCEWMYSDEELCVRGKIFVQTQTPPPGLSRAEILEMDALWQEHEIYHEGSFYEHSRYAHEQQMDRLARAEDVDFAPTKLPAASGLLVHRWLGEGTLVPVFSFAGARVSESAQGKRGFVQEFGAKTSGLGAAGDVDLLDAIIGELMKTATPVTIGSPGPIR